MSKHTYNLAFVFPGQGSQSLGMLSELAAGNEEVKHTFERASDVLGKDLWSIVANGPEDELNQTQNTQPVMLAAGVAVWEIWCKNSAIRPDWMAGHSLGEYTALVCSGAMSFEDGIKLVAMRGRLMQEAVPAGVGSMAAILGLEDHQVVNICAQAAQNEVVAAVNFNAPGQVVIAGNCAAVERAILAAKDAGAKRAVLLPVSVPSHCALMQSAAEKLAQYLLNTVIRMPEITLIHNVDVASHGSPEVIRNVLKEQLYKPVRWVDTIKFMHDQGVNRFVECGPGKVLIGLNKRIAKDAGHFSIHDSETLHKVLEQFND
ncbi:MAG: ACP S-malonyltransferase [Methylococcales bacterium]|nr:ACP S-malonyltransferase [Methylococcales bacterium]